VTDFNRTNEYRYGYMVPAAPASSAFIRHTTLKRKLINNIIFRCILPVELGDRETKRKAKTSISTRRHTRAPVGMIRLPKLLLMGSRSFLSNTTAADDDIIILLLCRCTTIVFVHCVYICN